MKCWNQPLVVELPMLRDKESPRAINQLAPLHISAVPVSLHFLKVKY